MTPLRHPVLRLLLMLPLATASCVDGRPMPDKALDRHALDRGVLVSYRETPPGEPDAGAAVHLLVLTSEADGRVMRVYGSAVAGTRDSTSVELTYGVAGADVPTEIPPFSLIDRRWVVTPSGRFDLAEGNFFLVDADRGGAAPFRQLPARVASEVLPEERLDLFRRLLPDDERVQAARLLDG